VTEVDFYILKAEDLEHRPRFACRLAERAFRRGHRVYLHTADEAAAREIDALLWSFKPQSFLPHGLTGSDEASRIGIGWGQDPGPHQDVMINLDLVVPEFVGRFQRVLEIVVQHPAIQDPLRASWRHYKHYGYPVKTNDL
jgi:DNA polymerase-3 subunit chi